GTSIRAEGWGAKIPPGAIRRGHSHRRRGRTPLSRPAPHDGTRTLTAGRRPRPPAPRGSPRPTALGPPSRARPRAACRSPPPRPRGDGTVPDARLSEEPLVVAKSAC